MAAKKVAHFTPELFRFLRQLERNNKREWFEKNKERYVEHVRDPLLRFIEEFAPRLKKINRHFVADPRPHGGSMFRIYRDTRFSRDKRPYKTAASAQFRHLRGKDVHAPGFYLHLGLDGVFAGMGIWHPDGPSVAKIRRAMVEKASAWRRIVRDPVFRKKLRMGGESLVRPPRGFDAEHPLIEDLKRKDFVIFAEFHEAMACRSDFLDRFTDSCRTARPYVGFLTRAVGLEW